MTNGLHVMLSNTVLRQSGALSYSSMLTSLHVSPSSISVFAATQRKRSVFLHVTATCKKTLQSLEQQVRKELSA